MVVAKSILVALMASFGGFIVGVSLAWSGPIESTKFIRATYVFQPSPMHWAFICSVIAVGAAIMCVPVGIMISSFGRKPIMLGMVLPSIIGWALVIGAAHLSMMYIGRLLIGMGNGGIGVAVTIYNNEVAELHMRGMLNCFFHLMLVHGILYAYILGSCQDFQAYNFACGLLPLVYAAILMWVPESPVYLVQRNRDEKAQAILQWLRGPDANIEREMMAIKNRYQPDSYSTKEALREKATMRSLLAVIGLILFQQFTGFNAYVFYIKLMFREDNYKASIELCAVIFAIAQVVAAYVTALVIQKSERKLWLFASGLMMLLASILLALNFQFLRDSDSKWLIASASLMYSAGHSLGVGPLVWVVMIEMFSERALPICVAIVSTCSWIFALAIVAVFPFVIKSNTPALIFGVFAIFSCGGCIFTITYIPETHSKSMRKIRSSLS
ncbi:PREDICTED: facilitated trehalose transporter Tret1-like [Drosophila arizonae]|uniref:Facilitated trehalose transporter Tret1-like n=1 Tax=Drosophila arizonae TaxID=7263 RepID=A0ABM1PNR3_DROAR|nr:PREDICTED: facilitated trehalose transporter Tret1-like [Drosophila arizonae]